MLRQLIFMIFSPHKYIFHIYLFVFVLCLVYPMLRVILHCPFVIPHSVFSNVYLNGYDEHFHQHQEIGQSPPMYTH
jgi:uncharacterized membrane protein YesL